MEEKRMEGALENVAGKVQETVGVLSGDTRTQVEGKVRQVSGTVKNIYGAAAEQVRDVADTVGQTVGQAVEKQPVAALVTAGIIGFFLGCMVARRT